MSTLLRNPPRPTAARIDPAHPPTGKRSVRNWLGKIGAMAPRIEAVYGGFDTRGRLVAGVALSPQAGLTGLLFLAPVSRGCEKAAAAALQACRNEVDPRRVRLLQALVEPGDTRQIATLRDTGFRRITTLAYMHSAPRRSMSVPPVPAGVELQSFRPGLTGAFIEALDASYVGSLDCAALRGWRETCDILAGHRAVGVFDPALWTLVIIANRPAGVLLMNRIPEAVCVELVYFGLAPEHRGRGLGGILLRRALGACAAEGHSSVTLAVDMENAPAIALYRRAGFKRTDVREVMVFPVAAARGLSDENGTTEECG